MNGTTKKGGLGQKINSNGFSIIEILVGISIFVMLSLAVWSFQENIFSINTFISRELIIQQETRQAFNKMSSEIRSLSPSSVGAYPIAQVGTSSFTFFSDIDDDGLKEQIRYFLDGNTFKKGILSPTGSPATYNQANEIINNSIKDIVNNDIPIFEFFDSYYDGSGVALLYPIDTLEIRLIKINVIIDQNPTRPPAPINVTTQISMRNLKDNL